MIEAITFFSGISVATFFACGIFFFKFFKASRDQFYLMFSLACWMFAFERILILTIVGPLQTSRIDNTLWVYLLRLTAFLLIVFAIYSKNKGQRKA